MEKELIEKIKDRSLIKAKLYRICYSSKDRHNEVHVRWREVRWYKSAPYTIIGEPKLPEYPILLHYDSNFSAS